MCCADAPGPPGDPRGRPPQVALPEGPLSMSLLLALEPVALRRLLRLGLRTGLEEGEFDQLCSASANAMGLAPAALRERLQARGWLGWDPGRHCWRTRLGAAPLAPPPQD
jgi:hypothetical protein